MKKEQDWYFTFGWGQRLSGGYVVVYGTHNSARLEMIIKYSDEWSVQYASAKEAGVEQFNLKKIT